MIRFPAEWEPHAGTFLTWPWNGDVWGSHHEAAMDTIATAARILARREWVWIGVPDAESIPLVEDWVGVEDHVRAWVMPSDDVWVRDHGPTFVIDGGTVAVDWNFDAWGGKYPFARDALAAGRIAAHLGARRRRSSLVLEGGALETDGQGTLLCTRSVALAPNRNPGADEAEAEAELRRQLGVERIVWLDAGMARDDTDGHVDTLARFAPDGCVLVHAPEDPEHPDHDALSRNLGVLTRAFPDRTRRLPAPRLPGDADGLPATYANYYVANGVVLVPAYGCAEDAAAVEMVARHHPGRVAVPIDCRALITQGGAIHCATQQVPRV